MKRAADRTQDTIKASIATGDGPVGEAMVYATEGGKALRAFLVLEGAKVHGIDERLAVPAATAIECIHAYSLVHDDMPIMDDDDLRRGRPTVHKVWDDATAMLVGDALQSLAFDCIGHGDLPAKNKLALSVLLARAAGVQGMVGGQALDIAAETAEAPLTLDEIILLQSKKTGALIEWAAEAGPRMADADIGPMRRYGQALGLAFQIADDILDETGDEAAAGKRLYKDADAGKATFVSLLGLEGAKARAEDLVNQALDALGHYGAEADALRAAARFVIERRH
ncbi:MAG: polyprenyl synthetase family protein [Pseudomonadota bacterium]